MKDEKSNGSEKAKPNHINVAIITTSGSWPHDGYESVPVNQPIKVMLQRAAKELKLTDTNGWVLQFGDKQLNGEASYADSGLTGEVDLNFGPPKGGGGNA